MTLLLLQSGPGRAGAAGGGGGGFGAEATAFLARTSGLDATHTNAYGALIDGLVADGIWTKLDVLHVYATQDSTTAKLNLVSTSYNGIANGSPDFVADQGFLGVDHSSTVYINTQFNASTASGRYVQNSAHVSVWNLSNVTSTPDGDGVAIGHSDSGFGNFTNISPRRQSGNIDLRINGDTNGITTANSNATGHYISTRVNGTTMQGYKNGVSLGSISHNSTTLYNGNTYILAINRAGSPMWGYAGRLAAATIGSGFTSGEALTFYNRLRTYMTSMGVP